MSFLYGTILVRDSKVGVGTELTVVQKYGKQDSGTTKHLPSPQGEMKLARFQVPNVKNTKRGELKYLGFLTFLLKFSLGLFFSFKA